VRKLYGVPKPREPVGAKDGHGDGEILDVSLPRSLGLVEQCDLKREHGNAVSRRSADILDWASYPRVATIGPLTTRSVLQEELHPISVNTLGMDLVEGHSQSFPGLPFLKHAGTLRWDCNTEVPALSQVVP
jgi:hypothetical protein